MWLVEIEFVLHQKLSQRIRQVRVKVKIRMSHLGWQQHLMLLVT